MFTLPQPNTRVKIWPHSHLCQQRLSAEPSISPFPSCNEVPNSPIRMVSEKPSRRPRLSFCNKDGNKAFLYFHCVREDYVDSSNKALQPLQSREVMMEASRRARTPTSDFCPVVTRSPSIWLSTEAKCATCLSVPHLAIMRQHPPAVRVLSEEAT